MFSHKAYPGAGRRFSATAVLLLLSLLAFPRVALCDAYDLADLRRIEQQVESVAERAMPSVVALSHRVGPGMASGSGTIVSKDGVVLTAAHVVAGVDSVDVTFPDGTMRTAKVLGGDATRDVALVRINEPGDYRFVEMGHSADLKVGDLVVALGHSGGFDLRRAPPVRFGRVLSIESRGYLRSDCTLVGGDSGGPLLDLKGRIVGVHSSVGQDVTINNDVPVDVARQDWDRLLAGDHWGTPRMSEPPRLPKAELAGLNVRRFRRQVRSAAMAGDGRIAADPATLARWLTDCGMDSGRVKSMSPQQLAEFVGKVMGSGAEVHGVPQALPNSPAHGDPAGSGAATRPAATQPAGHLAAGNPADGHLAHRPTTAPAGQADLDIQKLRRIVLADAMKSEGRLKVTPDKIASWLKEAGMDPAKVKAMGPVEMAGVLREALGGDVRSGNDMKAVAAEDREILAAVSPELLKIVPSVVTVLDGDRTLALGTVIRADGFVLTKRSEIAAAADLKVRLADGRSLSATKVHEFADFDLAIVKVAADHLSPVTIPAADPGLKAGAFVIAPSTSADDPMLALGVVSVPERSLREAGGYLGVGLTEADGGGVKVGMLAPRGPAEKAGLAKGDVLESLDGKPITKPADLSRRIRGMKPGAVAELTYRRGNDAPRTAKVVLGDRAKLPVVPEPGGKALSIGTEVSKVHDGFPIVLQHDQPIRPQDCGGPIVDLHGDVVGLNVSRAGRIDTYAVPSHTLSQLLGKIDFAALGKVGHGASRSD